MSAARGSLQWLRSRRVPQLDSLALDQMHHPPLRLNIRFNVALGCARVGMPRQHLHVSE